MRLLAVLLTVLALAGCVSRTGGPASSAASSSPAAGEETAADVDGCEFVENPAEDAPVGLPPNEQRDGGGRVALATSSGELAIQLTAVGTPCTVRSFVHLAESGFYDGTDCHRLTVSAGLKVLQCGDPSGDGTGGPGYTIPDELTAELAPAPSESTGEPLVIYPRGAVAMAKTAEPDSGGSQFFLVYADSTLPPEYTLFGSLDQDSLAVLDAIAARGILTGGNSPEDGAPAQPVEIESASVS